MAKNNNLTDFLTSLANKIRNKLNYEGSINPQDFENTLDVIYDSGNIKGQKDYWDKITNNKTRTDYSSYFRYQMWDDNIFTPPYQIKNIENANNMFAYSKVNNTELIDFTSIKDASNLFRYAESTSLGVIDTRSFTTYTGAFTDMSNLLTIEKIIISNEFNWKNGLFIKLPKLREVRIEGTISDIYGTSLTTAPFGNSVGLSKESITSIVNALSTNSSGKSIILNNMAVTNEFSQEEWNTLRATKTNWTISLM